MDNFVQSLDMPEVNSESDLPMSQEKLDHGSTFGESDETHSSKMDEDNEDLKLSDVILLLSNEKKTETKLEIEKVKKPETDQLSLINSQNLSAHQEESDDNERKNYPSASHNDPYLEGKRIRASSDAYSNLSPRISKKQHSPVQSKGTSYRKTSLKIDPSGPFNELEKKRFLEDLYSFMEYQGQPISKVPSLGFQELDLYKLYKAVLVRGGMDEVTRAQEWKLVYIDLGIPTMSTSASYNTRTNYKKYLYLYELENFQPSADHNNLKKELLNAFKYEIGDYIKIESTLHGGQVYYASILKKRRADDTGETMYYVHYNGWSSSHDEWMPEYALSPLNDEELISPEGLLNPSPTRSSKSNYLIYDPNLVQSRFTSPRKKNKSSPGSGHKSGGSNSRSTASSLDEWNESLDEELTDKSAPLSPNKIKFKFDSSLKKRVIDRKPVSFYRSVEDLDEDSHLLKRISETDEIEEHFFEQLDENGLKRSHILHPNQDNYYENNEGSTDEEVINEKNIGASFTPRRSNRSTNTLQLPVVNKAKRKQQIPKTSQDTNNFAYHSPMMDAYYQHSHYSYSSDESPLAFRDRERSERIRFDQIPLKKDPKPISQQSMHYNRLGTEPFVGLLESIDFIDAVKALNEEAKSMKSASEKEHGELVLNKRLPEQETNKSMNNEELKLLKMSIFEAEKRLDEIRSEYFQCSAYLSDLKGQNKITSLAEKGY